MLLRIIRWFQNIQQTSPDEPEPTPKRGKSKSATAGNVDDRFEMKQTQEKANVQLALSQVRTLAIRSSSTNSVLIAALESLYDATTISNHAQKDTYKFALKACRENESSGPLHGLIIRLLGTDEAKKTQVALEAWKKSQKKNIQESKEDNIDDKTTSNYRPSQQWGNFWP